VGELLVPLPARKRAASADVRSPRRAGAGAGAGERRDRALGEVAALGWPTRDEDKAFSAADGRALGMNPSAVRVVPASAAGALVGEGTLAFEAGEGRFEGPVAAGQQLGREDVALYREAFAAQKRTDWAAADRALARLTDRRLVGHVLLERLLHPTAYRAQFSELRRWLEQYGDHPGADRVYTLAAKRRPAGAADPARPVEVAPMQSGVEAAAMQAGTEVAPRRRDVGGPGEAAFQRAARRIEGALRTGRTREALRLLGEVATSGRLSDADYERLRARVAARAYYEGSAGTALALALAGDGGAVRSTESAPDVHWIAGLAAWRLGRVEAAGRHFREMAAFDGQSPWQAAAAAFWAGRAAALGGQMTQARRWYGQAARFPRTFYGLLAGRVLQQETGFAWQGPALTPARLARVAETPAGGRAVGLLQVGRRDLARGELRRLRPSEGSALGESVMALALAARMPRLALELGDAMPAPTGVPYDAALFPVPGWTPRGGFTVDRALLFALMRQESRFDSQAVSHRGATGLMQIMPGTARRIADLDRRLSEADSARLQDPVVNLTLGQRYIQHLLSLPVVQGNLFMLAVAYNGGPGTLERWRGQLSDIEDPLLFIESIPYGETRRFVERFLTNFWMYRMRLEQTPVSLVALAAAQWPMYSPQDGSGRRYGEQVAEHVVDSEDSGG